MTVNRHSGPLVVAGRAGSRRRWTRGSGGGGRSGVVAVIGVGRITVVVVVVGVEDEVAFFRGSRRVASRAPVLRRDS